MATLRRAVRSPTMSFSERSSRSGASPSGLGSGSTSNGRRRPARTWPASGSMSMVQLDLTRREAAILLALLNEQTSSEWQELSALRVRLKELVTGRKERYGE